MGDFKKVGDVVNYGYYDLRVKSTNNPDCYNAEAVDQGIEIYLLTVPGERLFNLSFGSPLWSALFTKNSDTIVNESREKIYSDVETALNITIDRDTADLVSDSEDYHIFLIRFKYSTNDGAIQNHMFQRRFSN